jgi:hypothetical protein
VEQLLNTKESEFISLVDLGLAYRKAKVDAYYSSVLVRSAFVDYEKNLVSNLRKFKKRLVQRPKTIPLGGRKTMVIIVPSFSQSDDRDQKAVSAIIRGLPTLLSINMGQRVHRKGAMI